MNKWWTGSVYVQEGYVFLNWHQVCSDTHCFWCETNLFSDKAKINLNKDEEDEEDQENEIEEDQEPNDTFPEPANKG